MYLYEQKVIIRRNENVQRLEIRQMNSKILEINNSVIDSEIKWYKEFTKLLEDKNSMLKVF